MKSNQQASRRKKGRGTLKNGPYANKMSGSGKPSSSGMNQKTGPYSSTKN